MNTKQILIVSDPNVNEDGLLVWKTLSKNFETVLVNTDERAIEMANRQRFDIVVMDSTCAEINSEKLSAILPILQTEIEVVRYEGEPINELENKIKSSFSKKKAQRIMRFLILDSSAPKAWKSLPSFSAN
jgi:DNA-binding NtrC family response regulator